MSEEQILDYALHKKNFNYLDLACILHYSNTDLLYSQIFWKSINKNEWIFLTKNMISEWLGIKNGINTFMKYEKILMSKFRLNKDFVVINKDDPLKKFNRNYRIIKKWLKFEEKLFGPIPEDDMSDTYYIISPNTFLTLLMKPQYKNKRILALYKKTENLYKVMIKIELMKKQRSLFNIVLKKLNLLK